MKAVKSVRRAHGELNVVVVYLGLVQFSSQELILYTLVSRLWYCLWQTVVFVILEIYVKPVLFFFDFFRRV